MFGYTTRPWTDVHDVFGYTTRPWKDVHHVFGYTTRPLKDVHHVFGYTTRPWNDVHHVFGYTTRPWKDYMMCSVTLHVPEMMYTVLGYKCNEDNRYRKRRIKKCICILYKSLENYLHL